MNSEKTPRSVARLRAMLPYCGDLVHARWSGEACWSSLTGPWPSDGILAPEDAVHECDAGEVLLYAGEASEPELYFPYGANRFACCAGPLWGNPVLSIIERVENLAMLGKDVLWNGAHPIRIEII
ncbi:MAG: DUF3830 family protein [Parvularculaceae bacterium]